MASAILHGSANTLFSAPTLLNYLLKGLDGLQSQIEDVCNKDVRDILQQVIQINILLCTCLKCFYLFYTDQRDK